MDDTSHQFPHTDWFFFFLSEHFKWDKLDICELDFWAGQAHIFVPFPSNINGEGPTTILEMVAELRWSQVRIRPSYFH